MFHKLLALAFLVRKEGRKTEDFGSSQLGKRVAVAVATPWRHQVENLLLWKATFAVIVIETELVDKTNKNLFLPFLTVKKKLQPFFTPVNFPPNTSFPVSVLSGPEKSSIPTTNGGFKKWKLGQNMYAMQTFFLHVLVPICKFSRGLVTKFLRRSSVGRSLRMRCWLGWFALEVNMVFCKMFVLPH